MELQRPAQVNMPQNVDGNNNNNNSNKGCSGINSDVKYKFENNKEIFEKNVCLSTVLSFDKTIILFMHHFKRELSIECLLSLLEFIQYGDWIVKIYFQRRKMMRIMKREARSNDSCGDNVPVTIILIQE